MLNFPGRMPEELVQEWAGSEEPIVVGGATHVVRTIVAVPEEARFVVLGASISAADGTLIDELCVTRVGETSQSRFA